MKSLFKYTLEIKLNGKVQTRTGSMNARSADDVFSFLRSREGYKGATVGRAN